MTVVRLFNSCTLITFTDSKDTKLFDTAIKHPARFVALCRVTNLNP